VAYDKLVNQIKGINDDIDVDHEIHHLKAGIVPEVKDYSIHNSLVFSVQDRKGNETQVSMPVTIYCTKHKPIKEIVESMGDSANDIMLMAVMLPEKYYETEEGEVMALAPAFAMSVCRLSHATHFSPASIPAINKEQ
jgi:hypothetical protein